MNLMTYFRSVNSSIIGHNQEIQEGDAYCVVGPSLNIYVTTSPHKDLGQVEVQRSQGLGGERRLSSRLDREPEDPLRSVRKKSRKVQNKNISYFSQIP